MERKIMRKWKSRQSEHLRTRYINFEIRVQKFISDFSEKVYMFGVPGESSASKNQVNEAQILAQFPRETIIKKNK